MPPEAIHASINDAAAMPLISSKRAVVDEPSSTPTFEEILLTQDRTRLVHRPEYMDIWEMYKKAFSMFWSVDEIDLSRDMNDWEALSNDERKFISHILAFFAISDRIVNMNLDRVVDEVQLLEAKCFYNYQKMIEDVHAETYFHLLDKYIRDVDEKERLINAATTIPTIKEKADWAFRWIDSQDASFATRLVAFAAVEGIFFSGSFAAIFWLKKRGLMPGLGSSNEFISRDEGLHCDFACLLFNRLSPRSRPNVQQVTQIIEEAVAIERRFFSDALSVKLIGMNAEMMSEYIQFIADRLLTALGCPKRYNSKNPFPWMDMISMSGKTNFFEKRVSEYSRPNAVTRRTTSSASSSSTGSNDMDSSFSFDAAF